MVGVTQNNLRLHLFTQLGKVYALDAASRADWHEDRGLDLSVVGSNQACACIAARISMLEFKVHRNLLSGYLRFTIVLVVFGNLEVGRIIYHFVG